jgi:glycosyltransferase involved in cell wall biosynthesis
MRVLLFSDTVCDVNGVARWVRTVAKWAVETDASLSVLTSTSKKLVGEGALPRSIRNIEPLARMTMPRYPDLDLVVPPAAELLAAARAYKPDVIHASTPGPVGLLGMIAAWQLGVPLASTWHTDFPRYVEDLSKIDALGSFTAEVMSTVYQRCDLVLARSESSIQRLHDLGVVNAQVFRAGVDTERFSPQFANRDLWRGYGLDPARPKVLYVGRVSVEKNLPLLTAALKMATMDADVVVIGDGPYRQPMAEELGGRAHCIGFKHGRELSELYASSDLFVFPSLTDTLGQVVMEAQASGLPAIVSNSGGPPDVIQDGVTGIVVRDGAPAAWAMAIELLLKDSTRRAAMRAAALARMENASINSSCQSFWDAHEELLLQLRAR